MWSNGKTVVCDHGPLPGKRCSGIASYVPPFRIPGAGSRWSSRWKNDPDALPGPVRTGGHERPDLVLTGPRTRVAGAERVDYGVRAVRLRPEPDQLGEAERSGGGGHAAAGGLPCRDF